MRALFFNEGNLGGYILGQGQLDAALRAGLGAAPDVEARFVGLAPLSRFERALATRPMPLLAGLQPRLPHAALASRAGAARPRAAGVASCAAGRRTWSTSTATRSR